MYRNFSAALTFLVLFGLSQKEHKSFFTLPTLKLRKAGAKPAKSLFARKNVFTFHLIPLRISQKLCFDLTPALSKGEGV